MTPKQSCYPAALVLALVAALPGCGTGPGQVAADQSALAAVVAEREEAARNLNAYRQLRDAHSFELARSLGEDILERMPGSPAAAEIHKTIDDTRLQATAEREQHRLAKLWTYQSQSTTEGAPPDSATITSATPAGDGNGVTLVIHGAGAERGVSLMPPSGAIECKETCSVQIAFDDEAARGFKLRVGTTEPPMLPFEDPEAFLEAMGKAGRLSVALSQGPDGPRTAEFEVAGYDPSKLAPSTAKN